jgi:hypothetical protein
VRRRRGSRERPIGYPLQREIRTWRKPARKSRPEPCRRGFRRCPIHAAAVVLGSRSVVHRCGVEFPRKKWAFARFLFCETFRSAAAPCSIRLAHYDRTTRCDAAPGLRDPTRCCVTQRRISIAVGVDRPTLSGDRALLLQKDGRERPTTSIGRRQPDRIGRRRNRSSLEG